MVQVRLGGILDVAGDASVVAAEFWPVDLAMEIGICKMKIVNLKLLTI